MAGDDKPEINFILLDSNNAANGFVLDPDDSTTWAPIDITDPIVRVYFRALGGTTILDTMICVKVSPYTDGACYMQWNLGTLDVDAGTYEGEIELEYSDGRKLTLFDRLKFKIRSQF